MRKLITRRALYIGAAAAAGAAATPPLVRYADKHCLLAPDRNDLLDVGEVLTYGAQRLLVSAGSMAPEFDISKISTVSPVNHQHPRYDPYRRLLFEDFSRWRLYVDGMVSRPTAFSLTDLKELPSRTQITKLICEEGWSYIASWTGVPLSSLLKLVGASTRAKWVVFYPFDDFWGSIDIDEAFHPQTLLAYGMNGQDLSPDHGAPLRLKVPRQLGYKNLKFLARISVVENLKVIADGNGSGAPEIGYSWYAGI
jgi:DMSO/TMAO reductase YedYZ molybdopterin-dependent catalytic subunit